MPTELKKILYTHIASQSCLIGILLSGTSFVPGAVGKVLIYPYVLFVLLFVFFSLQIIMNDEIV